MSAATMLRALAGGTTLALLAACTQLPTPFQPLGPQGGYEETQLEAHVYRVTFQGNPATSQGAVLDMVLLRCADLTLANRLTHFVLQGQSSDTNLDSYIRSLPEDSMGFGRRGFAPFPRYETVTYVRYHSVTVLARLLTADQAKTEKDTFDAAEVATRLAHYRTPPGAR